MRTAEPARLPVLALALALLGCGSAPGPAQPPVEEEPLDPSGRLEAIVSEIRDQYGLPGLAAAFVADTVRARAVVGLRRADREIPVGADDLWHVGSITKSMTATLAGLLVEEGAIEWSSTVAGTLPDLAGGARPEYLDVTLRQLLGHRGGLIPLTDPAELGLPFFLSLRELEGTPTEQRRFLARRVLEEPPPYEPGSGHAYSNAGYVVAGLMLEAATGRGWEELVAERLFRPLGLTSAGQGAPATPGTTDQPWGHLARSGGPVPVEPGPGADNPVALGPAGRVHLSIEDLLTWAETQMIAARGESTFISPALAEVLHTPASPDGYALGIASVPRDWAAGDALTHSGSNGTFYAVMWIAPEREFAVVAATNVGGEGAARALDRLASSVIQRWLGG